MTSRIKIKKLNINIAYFGNKNIKQYKEKYKRIKILIFIT